MRFQREFMRFERELMRFGLLHGEMDALENAGRLPARLPREHAVHDAFHLRDVHRRDSL